MADGKNFYLALNQLCTWLDGDHATQSREAGISTNIRRKSVKAIRCTQFR